MRAFPRDLAQPDAPVLVPPDKLLAVFDFWIDYLGLRGWTHKLHLAERREFGNTDQLGAASWEFAVMHFNVAILDPEEVGDDEPYDMERTMIHELLHVRYAAWLEASKGTDIAKRETLFETCVEQPNERVSMVLCALGRHHPDHPLHSDPTFDEKTDSLERVIKKKPKKS